MVAFEVDLVFDGDRPTNIKRGQTISLKLSLSDETEAMLLAKGGFSKVQVATGSMCWIEMALLGKETSNWGAKTPTFMKYSKDCLMATSS